MRWLTCLAVMVVFCAQWLHPAAAEEKQAGRTGGPVDAALRYLREIEEIEKQAAQAKADARARLLDALGQEQEHGAPRPESRDTAPGLIGAALVEGEPSGIAFHYEHGQLLARELIWKRFHKESEGRVHRPSISIALLGYVEVPHEMTVKVQHAAGGVNEDHGTLFVGERQLGQVGDDTAKAEIYVLTLPAGIHPVRWVLTGGTFQNSLLKFADAQSGEPLRVFHDEAQRRQSGAADCREVVQANADPTEWLKAVDANHWRWVPLGRES